MREVSVRDDLARDLTLHLTGKPVRLVPDPALLLSPAPPEMAEQALGDLRDLFLRLAERHQGLPRMSSDNNHRKLAHQGLGRPLGKTGAGA